MSRKKKSRKKRDEGFVLDGSVALAWCFSDEANSYADAVGRRLPDVGAVVPAIWRLEVANAMLVGERRGRCDQSDTLNWMTFLGSLSISVDDDTDTDVVNDVIGLARVHKLSAYDAAYLEVALRRGLALATLDKQLKAAALFVNVELFDPSV